MSRASELFGSPGVSGFAELAGWDTNGDGIINSEDANFAQLKVWRDRNGNAVTDAGELYSLADLNITALSARAGPNRPVTTANGTVIRAESFFARSDGTTGAIGELIFQTDRVNTVYRGERGIAGYAAGYDALPSVAGEQRRQVNAKGYGRITDLGVAASNDMRVADTLTAVQASADAQRPPANDAWRAAAFRLDMSGISYCVETNYAANDNALAMRGAA